MWSTYSWIVALINPSIVASRTTLYMGQNNTFLKFRPHNTWSSNYRSGGTRTVGDATKGLDVRVGKEVLLDFSTKRLGSTRIRQPSRPVQQARYNDQRTGQRVKFIKAMTVAGTVELEASEQVEVAPRQSHERDARPTGRAISQRIGRSGGGVRGR
ncbi:unnamed protein product [Trichogramma brassicae]|uniref:Uncharacterized protein n=1 Tax=Trichogramma brassicae TaxID=86971 RepID=A0A6H5I4R3_9HYME|nr:unnamed protein product [Trichogramma brassicae]